MAHVIKKGSIKVPTQPKDYDLQATGLVFKSYDNQIALEFNVEQQNGTPADLLGANLRLLMFIYDEVDGMITKEPIPFITKNLITESFLNGQVVYILPEAMKAYNGMVEAYVYIEYPDGSTSDNLGFTFRMKRSAIDGLAQDKADYFIADFQQLLDGVKQEATDAVNEALAKVEAVSKNVSSAQNDLTILEDRIDQTNQEIGDLGKLKRMYSNSIDFGDYDYSGNPNLMPYITDPWVGSLLANGDTVKDSVKRVITHTKTRTADAGDILSLGLGIPRTAEASNRYLITALRPSTPYALTVTMSVGSDWTGETNTIGVRFRYLNESGGTELPINVLLPANVERDKMITHTFTGTTKANLTGMTNCYVQIFSVNSEDKGTVSVSYDVKLEIGTIATPYQPNLLNAPYYLSKVALGENLIKPESQQPVTNSNYLIKTYNTKPMVKGKKYTITLEGTKPTTQVFRPFFTQATGSPWGFGDLKPVEGLTDIWSATFTASTDSHPTSPQVQIYQVPNTSVGQCTIKWLKLEEGDTRTPNISQFKYFGEGLKDSNNPNDYSWDITPEYTEKGLNNTVSLTDPQSVEGLKNFEDGLQLKGISVVQDNFTSKAVTTKNITDFTEDSIVRFERWGRLVIANIEITNKSANFAGWKNLMAFPSGYTPISLVGWGGTLSNKTNRNPALSVYANSSGISVMISSADLPANQRCSGTVAYFTNDEWPQG
ncbi:BppU family phage baseplate upper protein [Enterococcus lactis]|uniref:BppU family phage baseplate upper protein n=1 Tax=Enterococcus lactis TaxID=357441 RepID=UPI0024123E6E|nr:BppU family phage baseplate upper protein [Enterococcus lactis]